MAATAANHRVEIVDQGTGEVVHVIETDMQGRQYERMLDGLYQRVDFDRFFVRESG